MTRRKDSRLVEDWPPACICQTWTLTAAMPVWCMADTAAPVTRPAPTVARTALIATAAQSAAVAAITAITTDSATTVAS